MGAKIDVYLDCVSAYSYFAILYLLKNRKALAEHEVEIEFHPVFLGGINVGSGNKPPWTLPNKAKHGDFDIARAKKYFGCPKMKTPSSFPILSLLPQRSLSYAKHNLPTEKYEKAFLEFFVAMWEQDLDLSKPELLLEVLARVYSEAEAKEIVDAASKPNIKKMLNDTTQKALDMGAFGCPWYLVRNARDVEEPFFGSDRFHYMWEFLGLPWRDLEILSGQKAKI
ncbi:thioredoxin-like protein [Phyllosticta capitalensis]|uniref:Glutathione S-transferase kappa n=1 Tax=Phyllosticta capitalensis TaxID=121624 RepID=A0ABR1YPS8_9PEZI